MLPGFPGALGAGKPPKCGLSTSSLEATFFPALPLEVYVIFCRSKAIPRPHGWCQLHRYLARWYEVVDGGSGQHRALLGPAGRQAAPAARLHLPGKQGGPWAAASSGSSWTPPVGVYPPQVVPGRGRENDPHRPVSRVRGCPQCFRCDRGVFKAVRTAGGVPLALVSASLSLFFFILCKTRLPLRKQRLPWGARGCYRLALGAPQVGWQQGSGSCRPSQSPCPRGTKLGPCVLLARAAISVGPELPWHLWVLCDCSEPVEWPLRALLRLFRAGQPPPAMPYGWSDWSCMIRVQNGICVAEVSAASQLPTPRRWRPGL